MGPQASCVFQLFAALLIAGSLVGCGGEGEAKTAVKALLNDPESAQFSSLQPGKGKGDVCGLVNAKNRMGGYVGNTPFMYEKALVSATIVPATDEQDFRALWLDMKANIVGESLTAVMSRCQNLARWETVCTTPHPSPKHQMCVVLLGDPKAIYAGFKAAFDR